MSEFLWAKLLCLSFCLSFCKVCPYNVKCVLFYKLSFFLCKLSDVLLIQHNNLIVLSQTNQTSYRSGFDLLQLAHSHNQFIFFSIYVTAGPGSTNPTE